MIAANVTKLMVFDKELELIGELDVEVSFPIKWFDLAKNNSQENDTYAKKVLNHLGRSNEE